MKILKERGIKMKKRKAYTSLEARRQRDGYTFIIHYLVGLVLFFIVPIFNSLRYSVSNVSIGAQGVETEFVGLKYFKYILFEDSYYLDNLRNSVTSLIYSLPVILALSLILAAVLNQNFVGRTVARGIFFLPVIIASSVVLELLTGKYAVEKSINHFGKIDILVNNAGLWRNNVPFNEIDMDICKQFIDVNIMGTFYFTKAVIENMIKNNYGKIINLASVAGVYGNANMAVYSATKGAIISFTKALAKEVADKGITVNAVSPGTVITAEQKDINYVQPNGMSYTGRTGSTKENADLICFLASDNAAYINGQNIQIDGCRKKI